MQIVIFTFYKKNQEFLIKLSDNHIKTTNNTCRLKHHTILKNLISVWIVLFSTI